MRIQIHNTAQKSRNCLLVHVVKSRYRTAFTLENPNTVGQLLVTEVVLCCAELLAEDLEGAQHHAGRVPAVRPHYEAAPPARNLQRKNQRDGEY
jgi:hypothetical protein